MRELIGARPTKLIMTLNPLHSVDPSGIEPTARK
jgi:hypothetical protein